MENKTVRKIEKKWQACDKNPAGRKLSNAGKQKTASEEIARG
jgi:hypothetical protein